LEILVAKSAGFCFGVQNAINKAEGMSGEEGNVYTYGPIIHNKQVVENLKNKGIDVLNKISEAKENDKVIIRSHGISKAEHEELLEKGVEVLDATCPYVKHIHKIVESKYNEGYKIIIIGDQNHPEVKGINGWCNNSAVIINSEEDINNLSERLGKICIVAQTTYNQEKWYSYVCKLIKTSKEIVVYNTICNATELRQNEAIELSKQVEAMIVIGGKESSNTRKLYEICKENCSKTIFVETADEINLKELEGVNKVGITAGASTPDYIIRDVIDKLQSNGENSIKQQEKIEEVDKKDNESNDMHEYFASFEEVYPGSIVEGKVLLVTDKEVFVDIGYKSDGVLPLEEASNKEIKLKEKFKQGDIVKAEVIKMNDGEGNVVLSRKSLEKEEFYNEIRSMKEKKATIEVTVVEAIKGGLSCKYGDIKVFLPRSLSGINQNEDLSSYVGRKLMVKIEEVKERKDTIELIVSRKDIVKEEREKRVKETFEKIQSGDTYRGTVKSVIDVGAFVNIGDIDVFVPLSELSWKRVTKPQDIVNVGQMVEVLIIKVDKDNLKATGSIKRLNKEPWEEFVEKYREGDIVDVQIVRFAEFGAFAEIIDGVDGLIHISNMSNYKVNRPQERVKLGQKVRAKIIKIDNEGRKVGLSLKDLS
jgi:small subunit ribosomal protein S1